MSHYQPHLDDDGTCLCLCADCAPAGFGVAPQTEEKQQ